MRKFRFIFLLFCTSLFMFPAPDALATQKAALSAIELRDMCVSTSNLDYGFCAGFISALAQTMLTAKIGSYQACDHRHVRSQQLVDTFSAWANMFPKKMSGDATIAVAESLARAFPCRG